MKSLTSLLYSHLSIDHAGGNAFELAHSTRADGRWVGLRKAERVGFIVGVLKEWGRTFAPKHQTRLSELLRDLPSIPDAEEIRVRVNQKVSDIKAYPKRFKEKAHKNAGNQPTKWIPPATDVLDCAARLREVTKAAGLIGGSEMPKTAAKDEMSGKYEPLGLHLRRLRTTQWQATFRDIEDVLDTNLPPSARKHVAWWSNDTSGSHSHASTWMNAGWKTGGVDIQRETVVFHHQEDSQQETLQSEVADEQPFDPNSEKDARERIQRTIVQRRGQKRFRDSLISAYEGKCVITGCSILDILEAAHITPYRGEHTNETSNGLLLRTDLHTLFDCGLLAIDPETKQVLLAPRIEGSEYKDWRGRRMRTPKNTEDQPNKEALRKHLEDCKNTWEKGAAD